MQDLIDKIKAVRRSPVKKEIDARLEEFRKLEESGESAVFSELCFCIMTANYSADRGIKIQKELGDKIEKLPPEKMAKELRRLGHRFPNMRAKFICEARPHKTAIHGMLLDKVPDRKIREWVAGNVKGLGMKEASHFLRNLGKEGCAIIDFHIVDILREHGIIGDYKTLTKKNYIEIESKLEQMAEKLGMGLGELDLYLWYLETGKILK